MRTGPTIEGRGPRVSVLRCRHSGRIDTTPTRILEKLVAVSLQLGSELLPRAGGRGLALLPLRKLSARPRRRS